MGFNVINKANSQPWVDRMGAKCWFTFRAFVLPRQLQGFPTSVYTAAKIFKLLILKLIFLSKKKIKGKKKKHVAVHSSYTCDCTSQFWVSISNRCIAVRELFSGLSKSSKSPTCQLNNSWSFLSVRETPQPSYLDKLMWQTTVAHQNHQRNMSRFSTKTNCLVKLLLWWM